MTHTPKVLAFAGSLRTDSLNKKLVRVAADAARHAGADVTLIDLREYPLPIYDGDIEANEGLPDNAHKLKALFRDHHGFLISAPEYNSSVTAALKNTIDWVSRPASKDEPRLEGFVGKSAALMAASPGALGGLRGLFHLRSILMNINVTVLPEQMAISKAHEAFADDGTLKDENQQQKIERLGKNLTELIRTLNGQRAYKSVTG